MSDVQFDESLQNAQSAYTSRLATDSIQTTGILNYLVKKGIVKDEKRAGYFLIILTLFFMFLTVFTFAFFVLDLNLKSLFSREPKPQDLTPQEMIKKLQRDGNLPPSP